MPVTLHGSFVHAPDRMIGDAFENMAQVVLVLLRHTLCSIAL
jgi:hypothetical protein